MEKCNPGYVLDVRFKRKGGVEEDAEVADGWGWNECGVVKVEGEVL